MYKHSFSSFKIDSFILKFLTTNLNPYQCEQSPKLYVGMVRPDLLQVLQNNNL